MSLRDLIRKRDAGKAATATPAISATDPTKGPQTVAGIATVAVAIPVDTKSVQETYFRWLIHFIDHDPVEVTFSPEANHAQALAAYPDAVAAEPILEHQPPAPTEAEMAELRALVAAIYQDDSEADQREALAAALADPGGALICYRAIASERGIVINPNPEPVRACNTCIHAARPGIGNLYCGGRDDLPPAYGMEHPLRRLPEDRGASCNYWSEYGYLGEQHGEM